MTLRRPTRRAALIGGGLGLAVLTAAGLAISLHTTAVQQALDAVTAEASVPAAPSTGAAQPAAVTPSTPVLAESAPDDDIAVDSLDPAVRAEIDYILEHWDEPNESEFGFIDEYDCMNFGSQALLARGWEQTDDWWSAADGDAVNSSASWRSSTAFSDWLSEHLELAAALDDSERDQLAVGDIVQFDWDNSGDRDHTGIVTRIDHNADGSISVYYAGHTDNTLLRSVDWATSVLHPGGTAHYWHLS